LAQSFTNSSLLVSGDRRATEPTCLSKCSWRTTYPPGCQLHSLANCAKSSINLSKPEGKAHLPSRLSAYHCNASPPGRCGYRNHRLMARTRKHSNTFMWRLILLPREKLSISLRRPAHSPYGTKRLMPSWHFLTLFKRNPNDSSPSSASSSHSSRPRKIVRVRSLNRSSYYGKSNQCICWIRTRVPISLHIILHFT
jgi:hypothetical protein